MLTKFIMLSLWLAISSQPTQIIDITPVDTPTDTEDTYYIPIFQTNDIHGFFFPQDVTSKVQPYRSGGLEYMAKYISVLRKKWPNFLWLDSGDQFQGGLESKISGGEIMSEFFNTMQCGASGIGNHEWDFGQEFLQRRLKAASRYKYYAANLKIAEDRRHLFENLEKSVIITRDNVKIGLIGLTTVTTPETTSGKLDGITFEAYKSILEEIAKELRPQVNVIVLLAHLGVKCPDDAEKMDIKARTANTLQQECRKSDEMYKLLYSIEPNTVDVVFAGHQHETVHHWINGTPMSSNDRNGQSASVVYLPFNKEHQFLKSKVVIEGPLPTCEKIFENPRNCLIMANEDEVKKAGRLLPFKYQGEEITKEPLLADLAAKWLEKLEEYKKKVITHIDDNMIISKLKETALGNLFTDIAMRKTGANVTIINTGSFRKAWSKGQITGKDLYEMFPFDNTLVTVEVTGRELIRMITELQSGQYGFYVTSGLKQVVKQNSHKLLTVKLFDGVRDSLIKPDAIYTMATSDFAIQGGDDFKQILTWYKPRNLKHIDGIFRDHLENYLSLIEMIHVDSLIDTNHPRLRIVA